MPMKRLDSIKIEITPMDLKSVVTRVVHINKILKSLHTGGNEKDQEVFSSVLSKLGVVSKFQPKSKPKLPETA